MVQRESSSRLSFSEHFPFWSAKEKEAGDFPTTTSASHWLRFFCLLLVAAASYIDPPPKSRT